MQLFIDTALSGVTLGVVYAAFALAMVLIWRSTRVVNFAQAPMAMVTTLIALTVIQRTDSYWLGFAVALVAGLLLGAVLERGLVRHVAGKGEITTVILTLGLFIVLHAGAAVIFGNDLRAFAAPFSTDGFEIAGEVRRFSPNSIYTIATVLVVMALLVALFRFTDVGLKMRAAAFSPEVARLLGVRVPRMTTLGWALAAIVGSLAGLLIAGGSLVHPSYMDAYVVFGFVAAVLGGLDSPAGAVVGGLILGVALSMVSLYMGQQLVSLAALIILVVVLLVRPGGIFASTTARRV